MASVLGLEERIAAMMRCGAALEEVESEVIDPCPASQDQKAALWLYAWSCMERGEQRDRARSYLVQLGPG